MSDELPYGPGTRCMSTTAYPCRSDGCGGVFCRRAMAPVGYTPVSPSPAISWWKWAVGGVIVVIALLVILNNTGLLRKLADAAFAGV